MQQTLIAETELDGFLDRLETIKADDVDRAIETLQERIRCLTKLRAVIAPEERPAAAAKLRAKKRTRAEISQFKDVLFDFIKTNGPQKTGHIAKNFAEHQGSIQYFLESDSRFKKLPDGRFDLARRDAA